MCDLRFAAAGAKFTTAFVRRGLIAEHGSSWALPRLIGPARALDLLFSGRVFLAEEAKELGVVNQVFAPDELMDKTREYATRPHRALLAEVDGDDQGADLPALEHGARRRR